MAAELKYTTVADVDTYATDNGYPDWLELPGTDKTRAVVESTQDINKHHGVVFDDSLWLADDVQLIKAAVLQALYISKNMSNRESAEALSTLTDSEYNDDVLEIDMISERHLVSQAAFLVDGVVSEAQRQGVRGLRGNVMERNR